jgi:hypothetical protein
VSADLERIEHVTDRAGRVRVVRVVRRVSARAGRVDELPRDRVDDVRADRAPDEVERRPF